jgi:predicted PurR-regulated permease PerM
MDAPEPNAPAAAPTLEQRRILWTALTALALLLLGSMAALVFYGFVWLLGWSYPLLLPIGLAVMIALALEPGVTLFQKKVGLRRDTASIIVCVLAVILVALFWAFLSGRVIDEGQKFFQNLPGIINSAAVKLDRAMDPTASAAPATNTATPVAPPPPTNAPATNAPAPPPTNAATTPTDTHTQMLLDKTSPGDNSTAFQKWLRTNLPAIGQSLQRSLGNLAYSALGPVGQAFGFLLGFGFVPIYVYYFLAEKEEITSRWHEYVPLRRSALRDEVVAVLRDISASIVSYFHGQIIVAACNGVLTFIGLAVIGVPYSLVLGIITGALSIVPFLGIICSIIPALLLAFLAPPMADLTWLRPVLVLVVFAFVQGSESMFITPRVQSHSTGLHPLTIIIGILFWSMLLPGLLGPIVAVPLTCAGVVLLRRYVWAEKSPA